MMRSETIRIVAQRHHIERRLDAEAKSSRYGIKHKAGGGAYGMPQQ